jgi:hypothetical protein
VPDQPALRSGFDAPSSAGIVLAKLFQALAVLRRSKPLHPRGVVLTAVLHRTGTPERWGAPWLDQPGEDHGVARLSRAVGFPQPLPDIHGLALTFTDSTGARHDLLLASTGVGFPTRFILTPRRDPTRSTYSCLFPYATARGPVVLAAVPAPIKSTDTDRTEAPSIFRMLAAAPRSAWHQFGFLRLIRRLDAADDPQLRFDPVLYELPGLGYYPALTKLREPSYAAARWAWRGP